jgi:hypothetical protein
MVKDYCESVNKVLNALVEAALKAGAPEGLSPTNALRVLEKVCRDYDAAVTKAKRLGYTSLANALQALGQRGIDNVPSKFKVYPDQWVVQGGLEWREIWFEGKRTMRSYKTKTVTPELAQRQCNQVQPHLSTLLKVLPESQLEDVIKSLYETYKEETYETFVDTVFYMLRLCLSPEDTEDTEVTEAEVSVG